MPSLRESKTEPNFPSSNPDKSLQSTPPNNGSVSVPSSLPLPNFVEEPQILSTKKERRTPFFRPPPRPPAKTCPPISRVFKRCPDYMSPAAQAVTFRGSPDGSLTGTPLKSNGVYDNSKNESFFEQTFDVECRIGAGYFGTVYKVRHKVDGKNYAIKIAKEKYKGLSDRTRKLEEVRKHEVLLPHPNCVHFYHSWEENGRLHQQFELCDMSLADLAETKHDLPESVIWSYLVDLLLAVQHLHDHNLIHMDIKPENIFIGMDGICKLGDFGLVIDMTRQDVGQLTVNGVAGDSKYMASELLDHQFTKAADIFSLGITILELACDLDLPTSGYLWHQLRQTGPDVNTTKHLSNDLKKVIQLMMGRDHRRRPTVKQILDLPAVQKSRQSRKIELAFKSSLHFVLHCLSPLTFLLMTILTYLVLNPSKFLFDKFKGYLPNKEEPSTPVHNGIHTGFKIGSNFSDDEDFEHSRASSTSHSPLARPIRDSSPTTVMPSPISSSLYPRGPRRMDDPTQVQSTPSAAMRHRSARHRGEGKVSPGVTPQKRLNFDLLLKKKKTQSVKNSSKKIKPRLNFADDDEEDSEEEVVNGFQPKQEDEEEQPLVNNSSKSKKRMPRKTIKPLSLATKFECFSDDNSDKDNL